VELRPGEQGITEAWIKKLHSLDDSEVYFNCKNGHPSLTEKEKKEKAKWEKDNPGKTYPMDWNLSLNYLADDDSPDKSAILQDNTVTIPEASDTTERVHEVMNSMTDKQKKAMQLKLEGYSLTETAAVMGTSVPNVKKHLDKAIEFLKNNF
jgi:RNA polymerase sigma factor (sigma-70 family)